MSEYLQSNQLELEEEEESDLDGFVTSDEEFLDDEEQSNDYSSEIRKIFGYDRRKYVCGYLLLPKKCIFICSYYWVGLMMTLLMTQ